MSNPNTLPALLGRDTLYRDNLTAILEMTEGRHLVSMAEVSRYTGLRDPRTIHKTFPYFVNGKISAETMARCLSHPEAAKR